MASWGTLPSLNDMPSSVTRFAVRRWPATENAAGVESVSRSPTTPGASVASVLRSVPSTGRRVMTSALRSLPVAPGPSRSIPCGSDRPCTVTGSRATASRSMRTFATMRSSSACLATLSRAGAMPMKRTTSSYRPPPSGNRIVNRPRGSVVRWRDSWVSTETASTTAPASGWPSGPVTMPVMMSVVTPTWDAAVRGAPTAHKTMSAIRQANPGREPGAGGGLVQDEDRGLADRRPGDRDALALAVRERHAALTQHRVIGLGQRLDEAGGVGETRRRLDRVLRGARSAVGDVVAHRRGEEQAVLKHHAHLRAERRERVLAHVARVDQHAPRGGVVQPEHEARECGLTASGRPHESDAPPRLDVAVDLLQRLPPRLVREVHALEPDRAAQCRRGHGAGEIPHVGSAVEEIEHALPRGRGSCEATRVLGGVLHGTEGVFHVCEEHDEVAGRHRAVQHEPRAEPQHQGRAERDEQVHRTLEPSGQPGGVRTARHILA